MLKLFKDIAVGSAFTCNGTQYTKASTRTARLVENNRVFYFSKTDIVYLANKE